jgi:hypothetical protein
MTTFWDTAPCSLVEADGRFRGANSPRKLSSYLPPTEHEISNSIVRFQVLTAASMKFRIVFWDVLPCKIFVHHQGPDDGGSTYL